VAYVACDKSLCIVALLTCSAELPMPLLDRRTRVLELHTSHLLMWAGCKKSNRPNKLYETTAEMVVAALCRSMTRLSCRVAENPVHKHVAGLVGIGIKRYPPSDKNVQAPKHRSL